MVVNAIADVCVIIRCDNCAFGYKFHIFFSGSRCRIEHSFCRKASSMVNDDPILAETFRPIAEFEHVRPISNTLRSRVKIPLRNGRHDEPITETKEETEKLDRRQREIVRAVVPGLSRE